MLLAVLEDVRILVVVSRGCGKLLGVWGCGKYLELEGMGVLLQMLEDVEMPLKTVR